MGVLGYYLTYFWGPGRDGGSFSAVRAQEIGHGVWNDASHFDTRAHLGVLGEGGIPVCQTTLRTWEKSEASCTEILRYTLSGVGGPKIQLLGYLDLHTSSERYSWETF